MAWWKRYRFHDVFILISLVLSSMAHAAHVRDVPRGSAGGAFSAGAAHMGARFPRAQRKVLATSSALKSEVGTGVRDPSASGTAGSPRTLASKYMILVDAGSSGSRVHVFRLLWSAPGAGLHELALPEIELPSKKLKVEPGLSSFEDTPGLAGESLLPLVEFAKSHVPPEQWAATPIQVVATAGLRLVPRASADAILESCRVTRAFPPCPDRALGLPCLFAMALAAANFPKNGNTSSPRGLASYRRACPV